MNALNERIESSTVSVHTPNELVFGEARGEREVRVWFAPGHYQQVSTRKLEDELATLARLLFVAGVREHGVALKEATGRTFINRPMIGRRDVAYVERLETLAAEGRSDDGTVQVTSVGQVSYAVSIVPGTLDRVPRRPSRPPAARPPTGSSSTSSSRPQLPVGRSTSRSPASSSDC